MYQGLGSTSVSVIIPTCNRAASVRSSVRAIFAQEGVSAIEVVVVDDSPGAWPSLEGNGSPEAWANTELVERRSLPNAKGA